MNQEKNEFDMKKKRFFLRKDKGLDKKTFESLEPANGKLNSSFPPTRSPANFYS